ncbi:MAG: hypothetical protein DRJ64_04940 [Thermoprotei archaeon]|nr:MAG: hypothetical protein DRJ64_04940 [Thermoprotei archaeon]
MGYYNPLRAYKTLGYKGIYNPFKGVIIILFLILIGIKKEQNTLKGSTLNNPLYAGVWACVPMLTRIYNP